MARTLAPLLALGMTAALLAPPAAAFEAFDGRLQAHGYYEMQVRTISSNFSEDWDITQWYNVFNLELELDILQDTWGLLDLVSAYVRLEVRYDCVYSHGCGMFRSINAFGDDSKSLPRRLSNAHQLTANGAIPLDFTDEPLYRLDNDTGANVVRKLQAGPGEPNITTRRGQRRSGGTTDPVGLELVSGFVTLAGGAGPDGFQGNPSTSEQCALKFRGQTTGDGLSSLCDALAGGSASGLPFTDDPFGDVFASWKDFRFTQIDGKGGASAGLPTSVMGPWLPKNFVHPNAGLADRVNPFDSANVGSRASQSLQAAVYNEVLIGDVDDPTDNGTVADALAAQALAAGSGANPYRPIPIIAAGGVNRGTAIPRGLYYPSKALRRLLKSGDLDTFQFNYREAERAWNRGASQQSTKELKEAYLDIELFDSRLWLRIGKQNIVWGKTELFRTTDQFNPQDLALASLPSLEESRIALFAFRGVYSFYEVGPLEDVRLEVAVNFDHVTPADLGACGEAYTPNLVCGITFGAFAHSAAGLGLAGQDIPDSPWEDISGWEIGGRLEFRWDRFSFAFTDFYGYNDFPRAERISTFDRNVDPATGRPRRFETYGFGRCVTGAEAACLVPGPQSRTDPLQLALAGAPGNSLLEHHANQQLFAMICSTTIGFSTLDTTACAQTVFGSTADALSTPGLLSVAEAIGGILAGSPGAAAAVGNVLVVGAPLPVVTLDASATDGANANINGPAGDPCIDPRAVAKGFGPCGTPVPGPISLFGSPLSASLSPEQEALLGCGPFWGTHCDLSGIDLLNAEASALLQSFGGVEGTGEGFRADIGHQPGTIRGGIPWYSRAAGDGAPGGALCTFGNLLSNPDKGSATAKLPGCRGPGDAGYNAVQDGDPTAVVTVLNPTLPLFTGTIVEEMFNDGRFAAVGTAGHPFTGDPWQSEMAAVSWNFQVLTVAASTEFAVPVDNFDGLALKINRSFSTRKGRCSFVQPQFCGTPQALYAVVGVARNTVQAGGNGRFGRRTFVWHSGGEVILAYDKRNVLGFSMDFAEDVTKTNWGIESTWIEGVALTDNNAFDGLRRTNEYNLTISMDRPTFVNFLNANRTFFITTQWFFRYWDNYKSGVTANGPWNILGILLISTGYYQDRLLPSVVFVYDVQSQSGAAIPQVTYRYNEAFSVSIGAALFLGQTQLRDVPVNPAGTVGNQQGKYAYQTGVQNGLAVVQERDEVFLRVRYTF